MGQTHSACEIIRQNGGLLLWSSLHAACTDSVRPVIATTTAGSAATPQKACCREGIQDRKSRQHQIRFQRRFLSGSSGCCGGGVGEGEEGNGGGRDDSAG